MVNINKDHWLYGLALGTIFPVLSFFGYYYWKFSLFSFNDFMETLLANRQLITAISIPSLLLNVVLFTYFINGKKDKTAKGIFTVTFIYALGAFLFKTLG
jgi:hypothetical protein